MSPVTHFLSGWVFGNCFRLNRRERAAVTLASVAPDVDGLGIIPELLSRNSSHPLLWFSQYHHSLHTLLFAVITSVVALALTRRWSTAALAFVSFHLHLLEDLLGSRGPDGDQWPIPYLKPFSDHLQLVWHGQWALNAWQNYVITIALLTLTIWIARRKGVSPVEIFSMNADGRIVAALRRTPALPLPR
jgi:inner membrane protein